MARPFRCRRICAMPAETHFQPEGEAHPEPVSLTLDEYEALRLMDHEDLTHEQCAKIMQVSRTTVTEIYATARRRVAEAIVEGRPLVIEGGYVRLCDRKDRCGYDVCDPKPREA